jgi:aspartyl-tRNA(Asn)/glutamyl-tRNA(Gln) amidotransferase subunit C
METPLDEAEVRHVGHLARLEITDEEAALFARQLSSVLAHMELLNELDTENVPPTAHALAVSNVFRNDEVRRPWSAERALQNAPEHEDSCFRVPRVLDQENT